MNSIRIAAISAQTKPNATSHNLTLIDASAKQAAAEGVDLILYPELSLCGFIPNHPTTDHKAWLTQAMLTARRTAEPLTGSAVTTLISIARTHHVMIVAGLLEDAGNRLFNTAVLVDASGLLASWRKMHVPVFEMPFYSGGDEPSVAETPFGRIGVNICFDALIPESTRLLAVQNVDIVLFPFAADPPPGTPEAWASWAIPPLRARCLENGVFGVACNYAGHVQWAGIEQTFPGGSAFLSPRGDLLHHNFTNPISIATLDANTLLEARADPDYLFRFRRPELYRSLTTH